MVVYSSLYLFNLLTFLIVIENKDKIESGSEIKSKFLNMYLFFLMTGLPLFLFFFFKIRIILNLYSSGNYTLVFVFVILFLISLFVYFNMCKNFINNKKNFYISHKKIEEKEEGIDNFYNYIIYYNVVTNLVIMFFLSGVIIL